jgi:predicted DNA-binding transcriptional regulator YafY
MYHPTTRVLAILELLQARGEMSGAELAERLEVDRRTVRRYITMLQDLSIPIEATRGPAGRYHLRPGYKLPPLMLTDDEGLAILLSLIAARRQGIPAESHTIESALAKIERVLPGGLRDRLQAVQSSVVFHPGQPAPQPAGALVMRISAAIQAQRAVQIRYRSRGGETERMLDPYGLVFHWDHWYVVGWCHLRKEPRVFRLDRIIESDLREWRFEKPSTFDSLEFVLDRLAEAPWGWPVEVILETTLENAQRCVPPGSARLTETADGVLARGHVERLDWMARMLLTLECSFLILRPQELREALRKVAIEAAALAEREPNPQSRKH